MALLFLLPGDPLRPGRTDPPFEREALAARAAGARVALLDHEALLAGDAAPAVERVPPGSGAGWYRGRPLPPDRYALLAAALADRGCALLTGPHYSGDARPGDGVGSVARVWWVDGVPVLTGPHPDSNGLVPIPDLTEVTPAVRALTCRFVTTDVARSAPGCGWRVLGTSDGQVSRFPTGIDPTGLFEALVHAGTGFPLALTAGRLTLRALPPTDCARLADGGRAGLTWIDGKPPEGTVAGAGLTVRAAAAGLYRAGWGCFAITRTDDGTALGGIGLHGPPDAHGLVELGYDLSPSARGAGWATEAARLLASWAASRPEVRTVLAQTAPGNLPSQRVLHRAGFRPTGERDGMRTFVYEGEAARG